MTNRTIIVLLVWLPTLQLVAAWQPAPLSRNLNKRHPRVRVATTAVPRAATTTDNEYTSSSSYNNDDGGDGWSVADDWESLSAENPTNSVPDSATLFNQDIASQAAQSILADNHGDDAILVTEEDVWLNEVIEDILQNPLSSTPLYDTRLHDDDEPGGKSRRKTTTTTTKEDDRRAFEEHMGAEIAMLVRCNESPEDMLVTTGRALEELTVAQKQDVSQLLVWKNVDTTHSDTDNDIETTKATAGRWEPTLFFRQALATMFHVHASSTDNDDKEEATMDAKAISRWMTQSLGSELDSYTQRKSKGQGWKNQVVTRETKTIRIGPHDSRVLAAISKYSTYGTGKVALDNFVQLYMDALVQTKSGETLDEQESLEVLKVYNADHIRQVWRDLGNHGIVGPTEQAWKREQAKLEAEHGSLPDQLSNHHDRKQQSSGNHVDFFVDECEILDFTYDAPPTEEQIESGHDAKNNKYIKKGSHEQVPLANDGKTPLYMDEGDFVFIDEESCIGCMQVRNDTKRETRGASCLPACSFLPAALTTTCYSKFYSI